MATASVIREKPGHCVEISSTKGRYKAALAVNMLNPCKEGVGLRVGTANVGSMSGRDIEVADMAARRRFLLLAGN